MTQTYQCLGTDREGNYLLRPIDSGKSLTLKLPCSHPLIKDRFYQGEATQTTFLLSGGPDDPRGELTAALFRAQTLARMMVKNPNPAEMEKWAIVSGFVEQALRKAQS